MKRPNSWNKFFDKLKKVAQVFKDILTIAQFVTFLFRAVVFLLKVVPWLLLIFVSALPNPLLLFILLF